jgi:hypothetical protein
MFLHNILGPSSGGGNAQSISGLQNRSRRNDGTINKQLLDNLFVQLPRKLLIEAIRGKVVPGRHYATKPVGERIYSHVLLTWALVGDKLN